ncbi:Xylose import ATP-binding protein XylG [Vibrio ruber DSM 16370]|uniref:Xylose import ATP-binding protein XylG n=1 Tax=Vibrio ruber (strain DSM 16370 / JCM 11486 / BCRC 17186 / CECT 7878 / LMG 23124 / VR1) TaxID=1123498 RepID=A0A1R4LCZ4_VIBR1|nr:sugar ABC transporter ATP-binding protein [Vibrio ruber]SJN54451.1 Xylose import ATP-binding protein XylG [Vibrio ruber DSM 16370]
MSEVPFITLKNVSKYFGNVKALNKVNLEFNMGEVHCLAGKNGCGKSTLFKVISGIHVPEPGSEIILNGKKYERLTPEISIRKGIQVIYQDLSLFHNLTVQENIAIQENVKSPFGLVNKDKAKKIALKAMEKVGISLPLDITVDQLSIAQCQIVAICRAMASAAKLVIMDEPTASLTRHEVNQLIKVVLDLKAKGITVVFVSHKLDEVMEISDRITVIRDGETVGTYNANETSRDDLAFLMTGQKFEFKPLPAYNHHGTTQLEVKHLTRAHEYEDINFSVQTGEIVAITGLLGSGRTELCMSLFGMTQPDSGSILVKGEAVSFKSNRDAIASGIGYVSEDRMSTGLVMAQSIHDNVISAIFSRLKSNHGLLDHEKAKSLVRRLIQSLSIKVSDPELPVTSLSGGNAQRISIAKWIAAEPELLILDSPTVGVDIANKESIYRIMQDLAKQGIAILMISDEIPEVYYNSHRVYVMKEGRLTQEFYPENCSEVEIMEAVNA